MGGDRGNALLRIVNQICSELDAETSPGLRLDAASLRRREGASMPALLSEADEALAVEMRRALAKVAAAAGAASLPEERQDSVHAALNAVDLVIRGQLISGTPEMLQLLLPSFLFLVTRPVLHGDAAVAIAVRAGELLE